MNIRISTLLAFLCMSTGANAALVTIDFEDADPTLIRNSQDPSACIGQLSVNHGGFSFSNPGDCGAYSEVFDSPGVPNIALYYASTGAETEVSMTMSRLDGTAFDLLELDLVRGASSWTYINGYRDGALVNSQFFSLGGSFRETAVLNWDNLDEVVFYKNSSAPNSFGVDNIAVNVVPIPAAIWLFASGLALLRLARRRAIG